MAVLTMVVPVVPSFLTTHWIHSPKGEHADHITVLDDDQ
jgi:hypothetical protein